MVVCFVAVANLAWPSIMPHYRTGGTTAASTTGYYMFRTVIDDGSSPCNAYHYNTRLITRPFARRAQVPRRDEQRYRYVQSGLPPPIATCCVIVAGFAADGFHHLLLRNSSTPATWRTRDTPPHRATNRRPSVLQFLTRFSVVCAWTSNALPPVVRCCRTAASAACNLCDSA